MPTTSYAGPSYNKLQIWLTQPQGVVNICSTQRFRHEVDQNRNVSGLFNSFFGSKGSIKFVNFNTLELFEGFDVQSWETGPWAPPLTFKSSQLVVYVNN